MTLEEFAQTSAGARVKYQHTYTTHLIAERRLEDGSTERVLIACPACQSTGVTRLNFSQAIQRGEPMRDQCDRCRFRFLEAKALVLPWS
jgi:hypothetical protein